MDWLNLVVLALVQGITEFLPISSSAHLILVPRLTGWPDQGLLIDVAMHIGTLLAVMLYFRQEIGRMVQGGWRLATGRPDANSRLLLQLALATLPVIGAGLALKEQVATNWRDPVLIAATTIGFGVLLWLADRKGAAGNRVIGGLTFRCAFIIGLCQVLALVPGVSRSGITMTVGLFLSLSRTEAARFSMLLSIPTTMAAGLLGGYDLIKNGDAALQSDAVWAAILAFIAALLAIWGMMAWLRQQSFTPFVVYRLVIGAVLLWIFL